MEVNTPILPTNQSMLAFATDNVLSPNPSPTRLRNACSQWRILRGIVTLMCLCILLVYLFFTLPSADLQKIDEQRSMHFHYKGDNTLGEISHSFLHAPSSCNMFLISSFSGVILQSACSLPALGCPHSNTHIHKCIFTTASILPQIHSHKFTFVFFLFFFLFLFCSTCCK